MTLNLPVMQACKGRLYGTGLRTAARIGGHKRETQPAPKPFCEACERTEDLLPCGLCVRCVPYEPFRSAFIQEESLPIQGAPPP